MRLTPSPAHGFPFSRRLPVRRDGGGGIIALDVRDQSIGISNRSLQHGGDAAVRITCDVRAPRLSDVSTYGTD